MNNTSTPQPYVLTRMLQLENLGYYSFRLQTKGQLLAWTRYLSPVQQILTLYTNIGSMFLVITRADRPSASWNDGWRDEYSTFSSSWEGRFGQTTWSLHWTGNHYFGDCELLDYLCGLEPPEITNWIRTESCQPCHPTFKMLIASTFSNCKVSELIFGRLHPL